MYLLLIKISCFQEKKNFWTMNMICDEFNCLPIIKGFSEEEGVET